MEGLKAEDLIIMAGGFIEGADASTIHLSRQVNVKILKQLVKFNTYLYLLI